MIPRAIVSFPVPFFSSLITRSLLSVFVLMALILGGAGYVSVSQVKANEEADLREQSRYVSHIVTEALALPMWNLDQKQVLRQLQALTSDVGFCGARVKDAHGTVFASVDFPEVITEEQYTRSDAILYLNPTKEPAEEENIGSIELCSNRVMLEQRLHDAMRRNVLFMSIMMMAVLAACYVSMLIIVRPLLNIRYAMVKLSQTMEPITDASLLKQNEVGALAQSFNAMVQDLYSTYQALRVAKEKAEKADIAKSDFLANMTHELRTPLNSILGMTNLLLEHELGVEEKEMLQVVHQSSTILLDIVNDILDLSKIEAGELTLEAIGFDINAVVDRSVLAMRHVAEKKRLELVCEVKNTLPYVVGDPLRVGQILNNFISNAIKYTDRGRVSVTMASERLPDRKVNVRCEVVDTGIGIPRERIEKLFQKFTQMDVSHTRRFGGTGLGLAIVRQLVEAMGGTVGAESEEGKGSRFWFEIPFAMADALASEDGVVTKRSQGNGLLLPSQTKVLVAEDHPLNQAFIKLLLSRYGFVDVDICVNGDEALKALERKSYDVVLMDCFMPEKDGFETTRAIRAKEQGSDRRLPIVAMTANAMASDRSKCIEAGMDGYIAKPVTKEEFEAVLSRWIQFG